MKQFITAIAFLLMLQVVMAGSVLFNGWDIEEEIQKGGRATPTSICNGDLLIIHPYGGVRPEMRAEIEKSGLSPVAYIPRQYYLVQVYDELVAQKNIVRCITSTPVKPEWKIERYLLSLKPAPDTEIPLVIYATRLSRDIQQCVREAGASISNVPTTPGKYRLGVIVSGKNLQDFLQSISHNPDIYAVRPGGSARILNDNASAIIQSGNPPTGLPIWARGLYGEGQTIAVLDTGLDFDSCYFAEDNGTSPPLAIGTATGLPEHGRRKVLIYDLLYLSDQDAGPGDFDNQGHGTAVAGSALGSYLSDPLGTTVFNGMAPAAKIVVQDAGFQTNDCADLPALGCPVIDLTPFLNQAIAQGANIHNNSWGDRENYMPQNTYTAPTADMDEAVWRNPEFLIVCAAGNNGSGNDTVGSPSTGKNVISVGAAQSPTYGGSAESLANFSGRGWTSDGRIKPDLIAPGQTRTARSDYDVTANNCNTLLLQGTSLASPVTCGAAALVREYFTEGWYPTGVKNAANATTPTAALIKAVLLNGAVDMSEVAGPPPNRDEGWGRIHVDNSLYFNGDARRIIALDKRDYFTTSTQSPYTLEFEALGHVEGGNIKVTLVWTDYHANPAATIALVNDLDLAVTDASSTTTVYLGNRFDTSGNSITGGIPDTINNVEMVILPANTTDTFRIRIKPAHLVEPPQGFALVIGGDVREVADTHISLWLFYGK